VFLSAFTTKTAVYVLLRGFPGAEILVAIGVFMIFYGIVYAILENDMRRILAYSIVNQVGFMVTGAGLGGEMAINGAAAHAFTHIIYKALLLMSAVSWSKAMTESGTLAAVRRDDAPARRRLMSCSTPITSPSWFVIGKTSSDFVR